ncbi:hypothetical protein JMJ77_0002842 [Colletotrichum scovillei]|uniref:Uncharacterized protein n=1 Tax=Colletotrichum scovillei TaxID=1209932 RepID=A0A9P7QW01_9PEZI|nr:hypothetical protein JMJ78_0006084 [Colletotrichum scovillei]KAG7043132.1 hypothetical protein JMJ77_0002842 [Colletotrichum scovillei]KAG7062580.1 hypothetical protein JMJ76_0009427 [Colletotrichum scovillei]
MGRGGSVAARFPDRPPEALGQGVRKTVPGPKSLLSSATGGCQASIYRAPLLSYGGEAST